MSTLCVSETNVALSAEQMKNYWKFFGEKRFAEHQIAFFNNGFFKVYTPMWRAFAIYDSLSRCFINRLQVAELPYLTFHVFANGYMAAAKDNGYIEIYAPDGKFFAQHARRVKWWGEVSAYVFVDGGNCYLADITDTKEPVLLGKESQILNVEQNINGLVAVKHYGTGIADLYDAEMESITPAKQAERILFCGNGSFIICAQGVRYLYNAQMECLLQASFEMKVIDGYFCLMRNTLYDTADGSVVDGNNKPIYCADGKLFLKDGGLYAEDGRQVLAYCPVRPQVFAGHFLHFRLNECDLVFDTRMSVDEVRQAAVDTIDEITSGYNEFEDISKDLSQYFQLLADCINGNGHRKQILKASLNTYYRPVSDFINEKKNSK